MNKIEKRVYLSVEEIDAINGMDLPGDGDSFSAKVRYCVREQLQREEARQ